MNERQRFVSAITYQQPDRVPFTPGFGRKSTLEAWRKQGLPAGVEDYHGHVRQLLGIPPEDCARLRVDPGIDFRMIPQFEEKVLTHRPSSRTGVPGVLVVQDWKGNICEISDEFDMTYIPSCDHGIPHDVSWPCFVEYCRELAKATGWL